MKKLYLWAISMAFFSPNLYCQIKNNGVDSISEKIDLYGRKNPLSTLFAHFDKTIYVANENVWFTAYLLNYDKSVNNPSILSLILINDQDKSIFLEHKFTMAGGLAFGHIVIPDSIPPGDFTFIVYTNVLNYNTPQDVFQQPITIKATSKPIFSATVNIIDSNTIEAAPNKWVRFKVNTKGGDPLPGAQITYFVDNFSKSPVSGKILTDKNGESKLSIPHTVLGESENLLTANIVYKHETIVIQKKIPGKSNYVIVKFYPEGGYLIHGTPSMVGWEAKSTSGNPIKVTGVLYKDKLPVDTIYTDSYGLGRFRMTPMRGSQYEVHLTGQISDSIYTLPEIIQKGPVINISDALANDSLKLKVISKFSGKYFVLIHDYRHVYFSFPVMLTDISKTVIVNLTDLPKGLCSVTILDSLQRPCAERIFFAHYDKRSPVEISTEKSVYAPREKVNLRLKLKTQDTVLKEGIVSIACVQSNRLQLKKTNDIQSYVYLRHLVESIPIKETYMGQSDSDRNFLEKLFLIRGWTRYTWQAMISTIPEDTLQEHSVINFDGNVKEHGKVLREAVNIMVKTDSLTRFITTSKTGDFRLEGENLITPENSKIHLILRDKNNIYKISLNRSFETVDSLIIKKFREHAYFSQNTISERSDSLTLAGLEHAINLKTVIIRAEKDNSIMATAPLGTNGCGDYVCPFNVLNCPIHPYEITNHPPIPGNGYLEYANGDNTSIIRYVSTSYSLGVAMDSVIYIGCGATREYPSRLTINGIWTSKEFYSEDYSKENLSTPSYLSTIYWKHLCHINSRVVTSLSFYTSDITGPFKVIV